MFALSLICHFLFHKAIKACEDDILAQFKELLKYFNKALIHEHKFVRKQTDPIFLNWVLARITEYFPTDYKNGIKNMIKVSAQTFEEFSVALVENKILFWWEDDDSASIYQYQKFYKKLIPYPIEMYKTLKNIKEEKYEGLTAKRVKTFLKEFEINEDRFKIN